MWLGGIQHNAKWKGRDDLARYVLQLQGSEKVSNNFIIGFRYLFDIYISICLFIHLHKLFYIRSNLICLFFTSFFPFFVFSLNEI